MDLINKIPTTQTKEFFSVAKEMLYLNREIEKTIRKGPTGQQSVTSNLEEIAKLAPDTIRNIEEKLRLAFAPEKEETGNVCMANCPEVRDDYKDTFDGKDLLDYIYAVLHSPGSREKYKDLSKIDLFQFPYPSDQNRFWKLVGLGAQLRQLHLLKSPTLKKHSIQTDKILKKLTKIDIEKNS